MLNKKYSNNLRLRDLHNISSEEVDYPKIMTEVVGYNNYRIGRKYVFKKAFTQAYKLVQEARLVDPNSVKYNPECGIRIPSNIDSITFRAMIELQTYLKNSNEDLVETIAQIISIVCYQENTFHKVEGEFKSVKYDSNSLKFKKFKEKILDSYIWDMMGIYNWICKSERESRIIWQQRFMSVHIEDPDYEMAGASSLQQFNVIKTIKILCRDFNCGVEEAWQMSYAMSQTNSYEIATGNYVQDQLRKLREIKMKKQRKGFQ